MDWNVMVQYLPQYEKAAWLTLRLGVAGIFWAILVGLVCAVLQYEKVPVLRRIVGAYIQLSRNTPLLVQLFFLYYGLPKIGIKTNAELCGIAGLAFLGGSYMAEAFRSGLEAIEPIQTESALSLGMRRRRSLCSCSGHGRDERPRPRCPHRHPKHQYESSEALGMSRAQTYWYIIIPQTVRRLIPLSINLITRMIKTTSLVLMIGVVEVLKVAQQIIEANRTASPNAAFGIYLTVFILYFLACWPISLLAGYLEKKWK